MWITHGESCGDTWQSHVNDTWQAMCHNAWQRHACVTHGMPCVNIHAHHEGYKYGHEQLISEQQLQSVGAARRRRKGKGEGGGKGRRKGGKERRKERRKEKRKGEEKRKKKKEEEEGVLRSEQTRTAKNPKLRYKR